MGLWKKATCEKNTVHGRNPTNKLRLVVYPFIYRVFYTPSGAGFLPSTVCFYFGTYFLKKIKGKDMFFSYVGVSKNRGVYPPK